jgi:uridine phosphorylase
MTSSTAIINPVKTRNTPDIGPVAVMVATKNDLDLLRRRLHLGESDCRCIYLSRLYCAELSGKPLAVVGPMMGAPYAAAILETLIAWGARQILFLGWCGGIAPHVHHGDLILPSGAISAEGTSRHYRPPNGRDEIARPSAFLLNSLSQTLQQVAISHHTGTIWTTDAIFRETREQISKLQRQGVVAVEMELSALFTVARYRGAALAGWLVVSDDLSTLDWRPGFKKEAFNKGRIAAVEGLLSCCSDLMDMIPEQSS